MSFTATILIVDDTAAGRETLEDLLILPDYQLAFASNGAEALAKAAQLSPDLILLDVMRLGMDSFEVCRRLRADPLLAEVPIVLVTALDDRASRLQGIEAGADDFITKPFDRAELRARVRTITRLNRSRRLLAERAQFEWVIEQADDGYLLVSDTDEMLYANPAARLYLDFSSDRRELITGKFLAQVQKQYLCQPAEAWRDWPAQSALSFQQTRYLVRPESATALAFWLQMRVLDRPAGLEGHRLIHLRDVTTQMSLQRDMHTFHSALAHKLRIPLTHIASSLELLGGEGPTLSSDEMVRLSRIALKGARRLWVEIEDILQYMNVAKLTEADTGCTLFDFQPIVTELSQDLELPSLTVDYQEGMQSVQFALSERAMEWILREILENTKKFHPQQSPAVEIALTRSDNNTISLKVADNGLTLSPEQLTQVWVPYYQGEKYLTGEAVGMGLGLAIVASLIFEVGGTCRLYNRPGGPGVVVELLVPMT